MSDNIATSSAGIVASETIAADQVTDGTLGTVKAQYIKVMDGTLDGTAKLLVDSTGAAKVNQRISATSTLTSVAGAASTTQLLASNTSRLGAYFFNDSTSACYIALATSASTSAFTVKLAPAGAWELPVPGYTGAIFCIWDSATGSMRVTELT